MENSPSTCPREVDEEIMFAQIRELKTWVTNQTIVPELSGKCFLLVNSLPTYLLVLIDAVSEDKLNTYTYI